MRRISLKYARPGMVVDLPVFNNYGKKLIKQHAKLDAKHIDFMSKNGIHDLFIRDSRVMDVVVVPLFSPETEGGMAEIFRKLLCDMEAGHGIDDDDLTQL